MESLFEINTGAWLGITLRALRDTAFLWAPVFLFMVMRLFWLSYKQGQYLAGLEWSLLYIRIPENVRRSPQAVELILNALYQTGGVGTWTARWHKGKLRAFHSLEIVSIEGNVYFFIRTEKRFKSVISSYIYSQYPQAEITEVDDYTKFIEDYTTDNDWSLWGTEVKLGKDDAYPIKTYIDYGMDRAVGDDEEVKIDPLTPLVEFLGSLGAGEQIWIQIMITPATKRYDKKSWFLKHSWTDEAKATIEKLKKDYSIKDKEGKEVFSARDLTAVQKETFEALERSVLKLGFDTGIRMLYLGKGDAFRADNIAGLAGIFRQFSSINLNEFKLVNTTSYDYDWQDFQKRRVEKLKRSIFEAYVQRGWFYGSYKRKRFILNTEELATLFHFPGQVLETPTFGRVESKKAQPPQNLPR